MGPNPRRTSCHAAPVYEQCASRLAGAFLWRRTPDEGCRVLPDGCMDLIWSGGTLVVAGPDTQTHHAPGSTVAVTGLRFAPGSGPQVLGVPAHEVRDSRVALEDIWAPAEVRRLVERVAAAVDPGPVLEFESAARLRVAGAAPLVPVSFVRRLGGGLKVAAVAETMGLSERHLHRRCLAAFGYGPKTLGRVLRMNRAVELARAGVPFAAAAARSGYADRAHMSREVKADRCAAERAHGPTGNGANRSTALPSGSCTVA